MTWQEYCSCLIPLRQHFGRNVYTEEQVKMGFFTWKKRNKSELLGEVSLAIETNTKFNLYEPELKEKKAKPVKYIHPNYNQTDGFLERWLALHGCRSLEDMLIKQAYKKI